MSNFDLDSYKNDWKKNPKGESLRYSAGEIEKILSKKSRSSVRLIVLLSFAELFLFLFLSVYNVLYVDDPMFLSKGFTHMNLHFNPNINKEYHTLYSILQIISLVISILYCWIFIRSYLKIRIQNDVTTFIKSIIQFRKQVKFFIWANLFLISSFGVSFLWLMHRNLLAGSPPQAVGVLYTSVFCALIISVGIMWAYLHFTYGKINKTLGKQLKSLQNPK